MLRVSAVACVALLAGQLAAALDVALVPAPTCDLVGGSGTDSQGPPALALVIGTIVCNRIGFARTSAAGILGLVAAALRRRIGWIVTIALAGVVVLVVAPLTTPAFSLAPERARAPATSP
jgi:hypothetical protein